MMKIEEIRNSNKLLNHIHIHNEGISAKIYPNLGGSLQELIVDKINVIDGISNDAAGLKDYTVTYKSSILFPFPNRIEDGTYEYMEKKHEFPINEISVNNAIHGSVYDQEFEVDSIHSNETTATLILIHKTNGSTPGFPFLYKLKLTYKIEITGSLTLSFDIQNLDESPFPYGLGWHPYFLTDQLAKSVLSFPSKDFFECNQRSLPIKTSASTLSPTFELEDKEFDDAYSLHRAECSFETSSYTLTFNFNSAEESYLQVYTPPHRKSIAIEPMTCVANSFNNKIGLRELLPASSDSWSIRLKVDINS